MKLAINCFPDIIVPDITSGKPGMSGNLTAVKFPDIPGLLEKCSPCKQHKDLSVRHWEMWLNWPCWISIWRLASPRAENKSSFSRVSALRLVSRWAFLSFIDSSLVSSTSVSVCESPRYCCRVCHHTHTHTHVIFIITTTLTSWLLSNQPTFSVFLCSTSKLYCQIQSNFLLIACVTQQTPSTDLLYD